ncbi:MAG: stage II sporulation protein M [archaeon]
MKKTKELSIKTQFKEAKSYLGESKHYIFIAIGLFIFASIVGFLFQENLSFLDLLLKDLLEKTMNLNTPEMTFFILQNNLQSAFISIILGIVLGIFPLVSDITNGLILGYVLAKTSAIAGITSWWRILPHGVFELPAIFISFGLGIKLGFSAFINREHRTKEFKRRFYNTMNVFLMVIIPLLIIAAIIEAILIGFVS